jgi:hypothetical protein
VSGLHSLPFESDFRAIYKNLQMDKVEDRDCDSQIRCVGSLSGKGLDCNGPPLTPIQHNNLGTIFLSTYHVILTPPQSRGRLPRDQSQTLDLAANALPRKTHFDEHFDRQ